MFKQLPPSEKNNFFNQTTASSPVYSLYGCGGVGGGVILAFCHVDIDACIYCTCAFLSFFDCQVDFDVDHVQSCELVGFLHGIALYKSYYYYAGLQNLH